METSDISWEQRFGNFKKALAKITEVVTNNNLDCLSELETDGLIHRYEYTFELAWKTLQDLLKYNGYTDIIGPNPVLEQSLKDGYINDEKCWRNMKKSRELTAHTYNSETAVAIALSIYDEYYLKLVELEKSLEDFKFGKQTSIL